MKKMTLLPLAVLALMILASCTPKEQTGGGEAAAGGDSKAVTDDSGSEPAAQEDSAGGEVALATCLDSCQMIAADTGLISKDTCKVGCYMTEAKDKKDPKFCTDNVTDALMLPTCLTAVAEELGDVKICDLIGTDKADLFRGSCYTTVAEKTGDTSVCEGIKDTMMYSGCTGADSEDAGE